MKVRSEAAFSQEKTIQIKPAAARSKIFDPDRDAARDIKAAIAEAARTGKRVLIHVGGNWCSWYHEMERYFEDHADLRPLCDRNYVTVRVNWSPENRQRSRAVYFVLNADGVRHRR